MLPHLKRNLFTIFAIFFVSISPFLLIFSLGYSFNFDKNDSGLTSSLSVNVKTLPSGSQIETGNQKFQTPIEFRIPNNYNLTFSVQKDRYQSEIFSVWSPTSSNDLANFENLVLLPKTSNTLLEKNDNLPLQNILLLSDSYILFQIQDKLYIQNYDLTGLVGQKSEIQNDTNSPINEKVFWSNQWKKLSASSFWLKESQLLLVRRGNSFVLKSLSSLGEGTIIPNTVVASSDSQFLVLDTSSKLWLMDLLPDNQLKLNFVDSNIDGIAQTISPQSIWIWKYNTVYRLERKVWQISEINIKDRVFWADIELSRRSSPNLSFKVKSVSQGIIINIDSLLYFVPDFDQSKWKIIAEGVRSFDVDNNNLFWISSDDQLFSFNFLFKTQYNLGRIETGVPKESSDSIKISYFAPWKRVVIYTESKVLAVWFDRGVISSGVSQYSPVTWLENSQCLNQVVDKFQFCVENNAVVVYKNTEIW